MRAALLRRRRRAYAPDPTFITTWQTTTAAESITLPLVSSGTYDFEVDWGDGSSDVITAHTDAARIHEYAVAGVRDVRISGTCAGWNFYDVDTSKDAILDVKNWGAMRLGSASEDAFRACANLDVTAHDAPNLTGVTSLGTIFRDCGSLVGGPGFSKWDVSSVTSIAGAFQNATAFNSDIGSWDVSSVASMIAAFRNATAFNSDIGSWDVSSVTSMLATFYDATAFNSDISNWDVSSVEDMRQMFRSATAFNSDIGSWDVSSVSNLIEFLISAGIDVNLGPLKLRRAGVSMGNALTNTNLSTENYSRTLIGWANYVASSPGGPFDVPLGASGLTYNATEYEPGETYTNAVDARAYLTGLVAEGGAGWTITDGGPTQEAVEYQYDQLIATSPTMVIPMQLAEYKGTQVLFQDESCTIPVTDVGDPIGGVKWDGSIVATVGGDAGRPTWGGFVQGGIFNGVGNYLRNLDFTVTGGVSTLFKMNPDTPLDTSSRFFATVTGNRQYRWSSGSPNYASGSGSIVYTEALTAKEMRIGFALSSGDSAIYTDQEGLETFTDSLGDTLEGFQIGRFSGAYYAGSIAAIAIYDSRLSNANLENHINTLA